METNSALCMLFVLPTTSYHVVGLIFLGPGMQAARATEKYRALHVLARLVSFLWQRAKAQAARCC